MPTKRPDVREGHANVGERAVPQGFVKYLKIWILRMVTNAEEHRRTHDVVGPAGLEPATRPL
jgi:hypothetical protein